MGQPKRMRRYPVYIDGERLKSGWERAIESADLRIEQAARKADPRRQTLNDRLETSTDDPTYAMALTHYVIADGTVDPSAPACSIAATLEGGVPAMSPGLLTLLSGHERSDLMGKVRTYLTTKEVAELLDLSTSTVITMYKERLIGGYQPTGEGGFWRCPIISLVAYYAECGHANADVEALHGAIKELVEGAPEAVAS